jgi:hypothetical protein
MKGMNKEYLCFQNSLEYPEATYEKHRLCVTKPSQELFAMYSPKSTVSKQKHYAAESIP